MNKFKNTFYSLSEKWWNLKYHTTHRYHKLDLRNPGYELGWIETDHIVVYALFNALKDFVEKQRPFDVIEWDTDEKHKQVALRIKEIYKYWTKDRWEELAELDKLLDELKDPEHVRRENGTVIMKFASQKELHEKINKAEKDFKDKETRYLHIIIEIRGYLWT